MKVLKAIRTRRSVGNVAGNVRDGDVHKMIDAGLCAPNHKLSDPMKFVVLRGEARAHLGEAWGREMAEQSAKSQEHRDDIVDKQSKKTLRAPVLLVVAVRTDEDEVRALEDYATGAAATQNILLAAHALGYGAIWRTGDMVRSARVREHLGFAPSDRIVAIVYIGKRVEKVAKPTAREIEKYLTIRT